MLASANSSYKYSNKKKNPMWLQSHYADELVILGKEYKRTGDNSGGQSDR